MLRTHFAHLSRIAAAAALSATALLCAPAPSRGGEGAGIARVEFLAPRQGACIKKGPVILAGSLPDEIKGGLTILLNGRPVTDFKRGLRSFSADLHPSPGPNTVVVAASGAVGRLRFAYGSVPAGERGYRYHQPLLEGKCLGCHRAVRRKDPRAEEKACAECHAVKKILYPYVHGPFAAGKCLPCHDAHGSSLPSLLRAPAKKLCVSCHDQPSSLEHINTSRSRVCYLCHGPHAAMKRYLLRATF